MNPHVKSLCILGTVMALGLWNCDDSTSIVAPTGQNSTNLTQPGISSNSELSQNSSDSSQGNNPLEVTSASSSDSTANIALSSSVAVSPTSSGNIAQDTLPNVPATSSATENAATSSSSIEEKSSVESSSSEVAKPASSAQTKTAESSSSVVAQPKSSSQVAIPESSSAAQTVKKSVGCGKNLNGIKTGYFKINVNGKSRDYAIDIPNNYDPNKPYRLFYTSHWFGGSAKDVVNGTVSNGGAENWSFFGLKRVANQAGEPAIFIAPSMNGSTWDLSGNGADHALFSSLLNYAKTNLCIDESRVFATGFSFGAMMSYSLSLTHQDEIRAVATLAAANYVGNANSPSIPYPADSKKKIPYLGITGMSDGTCPFIGNKDKKMGGLYAALLHAQDNGCDIPAVPENIDHTNPGSKSHVVYDFKNCAEGYPVRYITFDGGHIAAPTDGQTNDDGKRTWAPKAMWDFFTQF